MHLIMQNNKIINIFEKGMINEITNKINELYITTRYKYLKMYSEGEYITLNKKVKQEDKQLADWMIKKHLYGEFSIGVFGADNKGNKFICFDIDVKEDNKKATHLTYQLVNTLVELGVPDEYINISLSGHKGFHVEIFFEQLIPSKLANSFYDLVINVGGYERSKVELRGIGIERGVKIPLGVHQETKQRCWFVDISNQLRPIEDMFYILNIKKMDVSKIIYILESQKDITDEYNKSQFKWRNKSDNKITIDDINSVYKPLKEYRQNVDEQETLGYILNILKNGIPYKGSRHNCLFAIAKYFKCQEGMDAHEIEQALIRWMSEQDKKMYSASWETCLKEIKRLAKYVHKKDIKMTIDKEHIIPFLYKSEVDIILEIKDKNKKLALSALILHGRRYSCRGDVFYMTYEQMSKATGLGRTALTKYINEFERLKYIEVIERNKVVKYANGEYGKKPNKYKILFNKNLELSNEEKYVFNNVNIKDDYLNMMCQFYDNKQLKLSLPRRQYDELYRYRKLSV